MTQTQTCGGTDPVTAPMVKAEPNQGRRTLALVLTALGLGLLSAPLLSPLVLGMMEYRTSPTTLHQLLGSDAAALLVVAPLCLLAAHLVARESFAGPPLAAGIGGYAVYTYFQVVVGQEYLRLPGNVERFFPLLLAIFILAGTALVLAWGRLPEDLPRPSRRLERLAGWVLLLLTAYALLSVSVSAMAVVMLVRDDPDSSVTLAVGFGLFTLSLLALAFALYRPLFLQTGDASWSSRPVAGPLSSGGEIRGQ